MFKSYKYIELEQ